MRFWQRFESHPPILLRLLARRKRSRPLTSDEIAEAGGLTVIQVEAISQKTDWDGIDIPTARAFMAGCGTDIGDGEAFKRVRQYLRDARRMPLSNRFPYLRESPLWGSYYLPLLTKLANHLKKCRTEAQHQSQRS